MVNDGLVIDQFQIILRLFISAVLGAMVGFERERQDQPAGLRTHIILAIGSTLAMTISINIAIQFRPVVTSGDPARIAAQVVSGIGFLGAGAILRYGNNIRGLTTATSLWTLAIVGLAIGAGHIFAGITATILLLIILTILNVVEKRFIKTYKRMTIAVNLDDRPGILDEIRKAIASPNNKIIETSVSRDLANDIASFSLEVKTLADAPIDQLESNLLQLKGLKSFKIS